MRKRTSRTGYSAAVVACGSVAVACTLALSGCAAERTPVASAPRSPSPTSTPTSPTVAGTGTPDLTRIRLALEPVADGFDRPLLATNAGDGSGRLFVVEQSGRIWVVRDGKVGARPYLDVSRKVSPGGERGLLGLAFAPDFETSGRFYVDYTDIDGDTVVARYTARDPASDSPRIADVQVVLRVRQPYANHNGGCLAFAPDGRLWVGMGDGGAAGDPQNRAQNPRVLLGKMLALDVKGEAVSRPEVMALGVRNPWRFSFDRETGDLWIGDVGQNDWEEIDFIPRSAALGGRGPLNLGWNRWEGTHPFPAGSSPSRAGLVFPVAEHSHREGNSVTGGFVYRGASVPALAGVYLFADFGSGWVRGLVFDGDRAHTRTLLTRVGCPSSLGEDENGELYLCDYRGTVSRIVAR